MRTECPWETVVASEGGSRSAGTIRVERAGEFLDTTRLPTRRAGLTAERTLLPPTLPPCRRSPVWPAPPPVSLATLSLFSVSERLFLGCFVVRFHT